ncbi:ABC transporter permease [Streptomyces capitiformicae]|uniref:ABC transporter permease n=1 Tax=Streptomyces capitiformicae TaxID=2014920 RepID=A0A918YZT0_9ACTN|nr:ABC transporter permease [Streptomyces capitiformicae]GHE31555.1 hypothetical protein GCM10017771_47970 [Streptomyces capitiformicae]
MSAATVKAVGTAAEAPAPRPVSPARGLFRAMIRLHQSAVWFWGLLVVLTAGALLWAAGPGVDAAWAEYVKSGCLETDYCEVGPAYNKYETAVTFGTFVLSLAPELIGAWAGAALIARELETGTARLAWTQSVGPVRWLAAKLAVPAALIVSGTLLLTLLNRLVWWSEADLRRALNTRDWFDTATFTAHGTAATAHALLGLAIGVCAGLLLRRSLPALAVGLLGTALATSTLVSYRGSMWPAETLVVRTTEPDFIDLHPSSHYWPLQLVETGIALALAAVLVLLSFRLLRRHTGGTR